MIPVVLKAQDNFILSFLFYPYKLSQVFLLLYTYQPHRRGSFFLLFEKLNLLTYHLLEWLDTHRMRIFCCVDHHLSVPKYLDQLNVEQQ